jgi:hypothetical protein
MNFSALLLHTPPHIRLATPSANSNGLQFIPNAEAELAKIFKYASKWGIDPDEPHPNDYVKDNGNSVDFKEDCGFAVWLDAQRARTDYHETWDWNLDIT